MDPFQALLVETLADLKYKDWRFRIEKDGIGLWFMQVVFDAPDASEGNAITCHGRKWRMSMHMTKSEIVQTALKAVLTAEEHETRENFLFRGRAIFGPHLSVDALWQMVGDPEAHQRRPT